MKANNAPANANTKVTVRYCNQGDVFALVDKEPTGNYIRHNYIVVSDITDYTETVLCFGITTAPGRNGIWDNVIPISSSNGVKSYINLDKVYEFKLKEFSNGHHHGHIGDYDILKILVAVMRMRIGLVGRKKIGEIIGKMKEVSVTVQDGVIVTDDPVLEEEVETIEVVESQPGEVVETTEETSSEPTVKKVPKKSRNSETLVGIFPFRSSSWTDEQLMLFTHEYEAGNYNNCRAHIKSATDAVLLKRYEKAVQELDKRGLLKKGGKPEEPPQEEVVTTTTEEHKDEQAEDEKHPVKTFSQKAKRYSPSFWTREELELFAELYASEEGKSVLKSEFALTTAGLISKNTEVSRRLGKASYNK